MTSVLPYDAAADAEWDALVASAPMGTLLHKRAFLGYHGERFEDVSLVLRDESGRLTGVLPAALDPGDPTRVVSHPGATFGGIVHDGSIRGAAMLGAFAAVADHYRGRGFRRLVYAAVPWIYHRRPSGDDLYALFRAGAERTRCDLSCAVDLVPGAQLSSRRQRGLGKARRAGVELTEGGDLVDELWPVVEQNLAERHGAAPVHTRGEMRSLMARCPGEIEIVLARRDGEPVAGVVLFDGPRVSHTQYIASASAGREVAALDLVLARCIERAEGRGIRYLDLGTSNRDRGRTLNDGLYAFKAEFGGGGVPYEFYELDLAGRSSTPNSS